MLYFFVELKRYSHQENKECQTIEDLYMKNNLGYLHMFLSILLLFTFGCKPGQERPDYDKLILGEWVENDRWFRAGDTVSILPGTDNCGFRFGTEVCYLPCGFRDEKRYRNNKFLDLFAGYASPYRIEEDTLSIWDRFEERWRAYVINRLDQDSLFIEDYWQHREGDKWIWKYARPQVQEDIEFDEIVIVRFFVSEYEKEPDEIFYLDKDGYYGRLRVNSYNDFKNKTPNVWKLKDDRVDALFGNFKNLNIKSLTDRYVHFISGSSVHRIVSFYKEGQLVRRVEIQNGRGPDQLIWGFLPLENINYRLWDSDRLDEGDDFQHLFERIRKEYIAGGKYLSFSSFQYLVD